MRRELSLSLKMVAGLKFNHDVVVPKGRIPALFALVERIEAEYRLRIPCFGHAGDGNIHVNIMVDPDRRRRDRARARGRARAVRAASSRSKGSISGEHGIGFVEGAVPRARAVGRGDRADEAGQGGVRSARHPQSRKDVSMMSLTRALLVVTMAGVFAGQGQAPAPVRVLIETDAGEIEAEIDIVRAPITAANFLKYVDAGLFDGGRFFRTVRPDNQVDKPVKIAVIQAAGSRDKRAQFFPPIALERTNVTGISAQGRHAVDGAIDARHRARLVLDLRRRSAVARLRRAAAARRSGFRRLRPGRPRHGHRPEDSDERRGRGNPYPCRYDRPHQTSVVTARFRDLGSDPRSVGRRFHRGERPESGSGVRPQLPSASRQPRARRVRLSPHASRAPANPSASLPPTCRPGRDRVDARARHRPHLHDVRHRRRCAPEASAVSPPVGAGDDEGAGSGNRRMDASDAGAERHRVLRLRTGPAGTRERRAGQAPPGRGELQHARYARRGAGAGARVHENGCGERRGAGRHPHASRLAGPFRRALERRRRARAVRASPAPHHRGPAAGFHVSDAAEHGCGRRAHSDGHPIVAAGRLGRPDRRAAPRWRNARPGAGRRGRDSAIAAR